MQERSIRTSKINTKKYSISTKFKISTILLPMISPTHLPKICSKKPSHSMRHKAKDSRLHLNLLIPTIVMILTFLEFAKFSNLTMGLSNNLQEWSKTKSGFSRLSMAIASKSVQKS